MKKIISIFLILIMLSSFTIVMAEEIPPMPSLESFAIMRTKHDESIMTVMLSKPVDKLYVNWIYDMELEELNANANLRATFFFANRKYDRDRFFVTLQQDHWIVIYRRDGAITNLLYTETGDIESIREIAFR